MIPDIDIWRSANLLVKRHGQDAPIEAAMRADSVAATGNKRALTRPRHLLANVEE